MNKKFARLSSFLPALAMGMLLLASWRIPANNSLLSPILTQAAVEAAVFLLPFLLYAGLRGTQDQPQKLRLGAMKPRMLPLCISAAVAVSLLSFFLNYLLSFFSDHTLTQDTAYGAFTRYGSEKTILIVLVVAILPALVEELFFRGAVLPSQEPQGQLTAIYISALCFAMIHGSAANFFGPLAAGLVFGYLAVVLGSVWPAIIGHMTNNLLYLLMGYFLKRYAAFGIWPYFIICTAALFFIFVYLAASSFQKQLEKGRIPRLKGGGMVSALVKTALTPGVWAVTILFIVKTVFLRS